MQREAEGGGGGEEGLHTHQDFSIIQRGTRDELPKLCYRMDSKN